MKATTNTAAHRLRNFRGHFLHLSVAFSPTSTWGRARAYQVPSTPSLIESSEPIHKAPTVAHYPPWNSPFTPAIDHTLICKNHRGLCASQVQYEAENTIGARAGRYHAG